MLSVHRSRLIGLCLLWLTACSGGGSSDGNGGMPPDAGGGPPVEPPPAAPSALQPASEASLTSYFRAALQRDAGYAGDTLAYDRVTVAVAEAAGAASMAPNFSTTTLQESGVDEADLVKTDGSVIYSVSASGPARTLRRHRIPATGTELTLVEDYAPQFGSDVVLDNLYLDTERGQLAALAESSFPGYDALWFSPQYWRERATEVMLLDVSDPAATRERYKLRFDGQLVGSRRIGSTLYLVLRSYPRISGFDYAWTPANADANEKILSTLKAQDLLPSVRVDAQPAAPLVAAENCLVQQENAYTTSDIVTVVAIDLASVAPRTASRCFVGSTEAIYVSERSLYLATTRTGYARTSLVASYPATMTTDIHKFALSGLGIDYRGSGQVDGHLGWDQNRKSFRFGEQNGYLRVITFTGETQMLPLAGASASTPASPATLSILEEVQAALKLVATLPNERRPAPLGKPGEQIYATRFLGNRGYLVTYRLTDPLYVLDLSDPLDPKIGGELQVSGYSDYLFPLTETLLLGVGKDAVSDGTSGDGRFAWYQGVKLSLIDVSDASAPREAARQIIGRRGTHSTVLHDHHGIAIQKVGDTTRVALPVNLHDTAPERPTGAPNDYFGYTHTGLYRFEIDTAANTLAAMPPVVAAVVTGSPAFGPDIANDRSVLAGDQVHYLRDSEFISGRW